MEVPIVHIELIDGKAYIKGRNVKVRMIAEMYLEGGATITELMERYHLTAAEVHTALAYYYDHRETFEREREAAQKDTEARLEAMRQRARDLRGDE